MIDPIPYAIPVFVIAILFEMLWTYVRRKHQYRADDTFACLAASVMSSVIGALGAGVITFCYVATFNHFRLTEMLSYSSHSQTMCLLLLVVIQDLFYYWYHRIAHRCNLFWGGHVAHHSSEEYNLAVALRQSSILQFISWPIYLPLAVVGFPPQWLSFVISMNLIYQFWVHTREINKLPSWIEAVFNTPSHHRVHHGTNPQYLDKNYAGIFIIWDKLFGTFEPEVEEVRYGITVPINSFNPIWVNVHYYWYLMQTSLRAPSLYEAARLWLAPPDWKVEWMERRQDARKLTPQAS